MKLLLSCLSLFISLVKLPAQQNEVKNRVTEYFQNEQYNEAIEYLMSGLKDTPDIYVLNSLGYAHLMNEETSKAELFYQKALAIDSANFTANKYLSQIEREKENFERALFYHIRMLRVQPKNASLHKSAGDLYLMLKMNDSSLACYLKSYLLQPSNIKYASSYISQMLSQKKYSVADSVLNTFLSADSSNIPAMSLAIRSAYEQGDYKEAVAFSNRWLNVNRDNMNLLTTIRLATANYETKNFLASYKLCDTLIKQDVLDERILYHAARALSKLGKYKESNELLSQCLDLAISGSAEKYFFEKAENFESLRQYATAVAASDTAYFLFHNPLALYNMGRLYETGLKNNTKAKEYYRQYLRKASPSTAQERKVYSYLKEMLKADGKK